MSPLKGVVPLTELSLRAISSFVKESTLFYSRRLVRIQNVECQELVPTLMNCIGLFRDFIFRNVPFTLTSQVASRVLIGIETSIQRRKRFSNPSANDLSNYSKELFCIREFANLISVPNLRELNIWSIEESLRSNFVTTLPNFRGLRSLNLGPGSQGELESSVIYHNVYLKGLTQLHHLRSLTIQYDCSDLIIITVVENCGASLIYLNINNSKYVSDYSVKFIRSCKNLKALCAFKTGLSPGGKIAILTGLYSTLEYFDNGEFLNFISYNKFPHPYSLKEVFMAENSHKLHTWCPYIKKATFQQNHKTNLSLLPNYKNLEELQIIGGKLCCNNLQPTLKSIGNRLSKLAFVNTRVLEERLLQKIFHYCSGLTNLALIDCEGFSRIDSYVPLQSFSLKILSLSGEISSNLLLSLLQLRNLEKLEIGRQIISDKLLLDSIINGEKVLGELSELVIQDPLKFSLGSLYNLIEYLPNLRKLKGLHAWNCLSRIDIANFQRFIRVNNMDVELE